MMSTQSHLFIYIIPYPFCSALLTSSGALVLATRLGII